MIPNIPPDPTQHNPTENGKKTFAMTPEKLAEFEFRAHEISAETLMLSKVHETPRLWHPLLKNTGLACLAGSSDAGKSCFLRQLAVAIVVGEKEFLGFQLNPVHKSVIYVSTEDDEQTVSSVMQYQGCDYIPEQLRELRYVFDYEDLLLKLDASLTARPADAVFVDCYSDAYTGDLKDTSQIRATLRNYQALSRKHNTLVLFLHHTSKRSQDREPSKDNLLSGQGFEAKMRMVMDLRLDISDKNLRHLCVLKSNYLSQREKQESHVLNFNERLLTFTNTGERVPFELLVKNSADEGKAKYLQAKDLYDQGLSLSEVAEKMGLASKSSVHAILQKGAAQGWDNGITHIKPRN